MRRAVIAAGVVALAIVGYLAFPRSTKPAAVADLPSPVAGRADTARAAGRAAVVAQPPVPRFVTPPSLTAAERDQATANLLASRARIWQRRRDEAVAAMGLTADEAVAYDEIADRTNEAFAARALPTLRAALETARTETDPAKRAAAWRAVEAAVLPLFAKAKAELRALYKQPPVGDPAHPVGLLDAENAQAFGDALSAYATRRRSFSRAELSAHYAAEKAKRGL